MLALIVCVLAASTAFAQTSTRRDTLSAVRDTTVARDTTQLQPSSGIDSSVTYASTDSIVFTFDSKVMNLYGRCDVKYKTMALKSERINVEWLDDKLEAFGVLDSLRATNPDSIKQRYIGTPVMVDGPETYEGFKIAYNFKTQKGRITLGETAKDQGYYYGAHIKKVAPDMLFIADGRFTTCSLGHPHYYFLSPEMRVTIKDKIVARPIYLYIADVPLFALPFGVFPSQGGRRSGIIAPAYGDDRDRGRYISHLGYYFALSDYYDLSVVGDWYTSGAWRAQSQVRYAKRYNFTGGISLEYSRNRSGEAIDPNRVDQENYYSTIRHSQQFNPSTRLDVDFTFASNNSFTVPRDDYTRRLNQEIFSNATLSKFWEGTNNSMGLNLSRHQNLRTGSIDAVLPSITFSHAQSYPFRSGRRGSASDAGQSRYAWYEMIGVSYNGEARHVERKDRPNGNDTTAYTTFNRNGAQHSIGISIAPKAGYFTVTPSFSYLERWYDKYTTVTGLDSVKHTPIFADRNGLNAVRTFNTGVSVSTKLYGMLRSPISGIEGFRHTVSPSVSYVYTPDFSKSFWGYYGTYRDANGMEQKYDRFQKEIYGSVSSGESQSINMSVSNLFEMKTAPRDTSVKPEKYQLLNLTASVGYNLAADRFPLSELFLNYRTNIGQILDINGSSSYNFYMVDPVTGTQRINKLLFANKGRIADLTNFSLSLSTSLRGEKKRAETTEQVSDSIRIEERRRSLQSGIHEVNEEDIPDFSIPWNLSAAFTYSQSQPVPAIKSRSANLSINGGFNLTENWRFTFSTSYDMISRQFAAPSINIFRDLHCWEMNFNWRPSGSMAGYRLEIRVKAPQLQDVKLTKQSGSGF
ncbi:MAG TPA: putative LPS assembly protein LptD [Bacteroidota bacterium]|nr:putative LPS assembly protein LptD [Bacteroidota bacterium]